MTQGSNPRRYGDAKTPRERREMLGAALLAFDGNKTAVREALEMGEGYGYLYDELEKHGGVVGILRKCGVALEGAEGGESGEGLTPLTRRNGSGETLTLSRSDSKGVTYPEWLPRLGIDMEAAQALVTKYDPRRPARKRRKANLRFEKSDELFLKAVGLGIEKRSDDRAPRVSDVVALMVGYFRSMGDPDAVAVRLLESTPHEDQEQQP